MMKFIKQFWLSIVVNALVLTVCLVNVPTVVAPPMINFDKLVHTILFGGISGIAFFDNTRYFRLKISSARIFWGSLVFPTAFGGLIEILQTTLTTCRSGDWFDFAFDALGAIVGVIVVAVINRRISKK
jgi:VanZ family protein